MNIWNWSLKRTLVVVGGILGLFALGCATIIEGTEESVSVDSEPSEAKVLVDGEEKGTTPVTTKLKKGKSYTIKVQKSGYKTKTVNISSELNPTWLIVDIVLGAWPIIIDAITGAWYTFDKTNISVELEAGASASAGPNYGITIEGGHRIAGPSGLMDSGTFAPYQPATAE